MSTGAGESSWARSAKLKEFQRIKARHIQKTLKPFHGKVTCRAGFCQTSGTELECAARARA